MNKYKISLQNFPCWDKKVLSAKSYKPKEREKCFKGHFLDLFQMIFTCIISTCAFYGALNLKNPFPLFAVAFGVWALFIWGWNKRMKKDAQRRFRERMFEDYMRSNFHNRIRF